MSADIEARVRSLLGQLLQIDASAGPIEREQVAAWDSLRHVDLIFLLEEEFGIVLDEEEMGRADSLAGIVELVRRHAP